MAISEVASGDTRQLQDIANILARAKKVVVVTGAGISTNCGIPDFRSEDGLYSLIQAQSDATVSRSPARHIIKRRSGPGRPPISLPSSSPSQPRYNVKGKDLFDSMLWKDPASTSVFYKFIASLRETVREEVRQTTQTHRFLRILRDKRKLVRCYTQNIDGLEGREGLTTDMQLGKGNKQRFSKKSKAMPMPQAPPSPGNPLDGGCEVVQLHGDLDTLRCTLCNQICDWTEKNKKKLIAGQAPRCQSCTDKDQERQDRGKRGTKIGTLRPNVVLYGENHPNADALGSITTHDLSLSPDLLLILGTSLHVHGLKTLVREFAKSVHARPESRGKAIFVNLSKPSESVWRDSLDYWVSMDCDAWVQAMKRHRPDMFQVQEPLKLSVGKKGSEQKTDKGHPSLPPEENKENERLTESSDSKCKQQGIVPKTPKKPLRDHAVKLSSKRASDDAFDKGYVCNSSMDSSQLLTPPSSRASCTTNGSTRKRRRTLTENYNLQTNSPSKRMRRTITVWEDAVNRMS